MKSFNLPVLLCLASACLFALISGLFVLLLQYTGMFHGLVIGSCAALVVSFSYVRGAGWILKRLQFRRTCAYVGDLKRCGDWYPYESLSASATSEERSIWNDPLIKSFKDVEYFGVHRHESVHDGTFRTNRSLCDLYANALACMNESEDLTDVGIEPDDWEDVASVIIERYRDMVIQSDALEDVLCRRTCPCLSIVPNEFDLDARYAKSKRHMLACIRLLSISHAILGDHAESFRWLNTGLALASGEHIDLMLSRMCQWSEIALITDAVEMIQQCHVGTDEEWKRVWNLMSTIDVVAKVPDVLRAERTWVHDTAFGRYADIRRFREEFGGVDIPFSMRYLLDDIVDAWHIHEWEKSMRALQEYIQGISDHLCRPEGIPHSEDDPSQPDIAFRKILKTNYVFDADEYTDWWKWSQQFQQKITLARTAISLERHYLKHGEYPCERSMTAGILPDAAPVASSDWIYDRRSGKSFVLQFGLPDGDEYRWEIGSGLPDIGTVKHMFPRSDSVNPTGRDRSSGIGRIRRLNHWNVIA